MFKKLWHSSLAGNISATQIVHEMPNTPRKCIFLKLFFKETAKRKELSRKVTNFVENFVVGVQNTYVGATSGNHLVNNSNLLFAGKTANQLKMVRNQCF
jgi:hypothetical protein